jgi:hypothetical protein
MTRKEPAAAGSSILSNELSTWALTLNFKINKMKLQYRKQLYTAILGVMCITACKKDFLNVQPTDRVATSAIEI